jgi:hypothetical protein
VEPEPGWTIFALSVPAEEAVEAQLEIA